MKDDFKNYNGLYLQNYDYLSPDFFFVELIETRSHLFDWRAKPHIHTKLYQLFYIVKGEGICYLPDREIKFENKTFIIIPPGFLHGFKWQPKIDGHIFTVSSGLVEKVLEAIPAVSLKFNTPSVVSGLDGCNRFDSCLKIVDEIYLELANRYAERFQMLMFIFGQLLINSYRIISQEGQVISGENLSNINIFNNFQKMIKHHSFNHKSVSDYASRLNVSSIQLNKICKSIVNKPALWVINEIIISEIKLLLTHTDLSISDICYKLNFNDPSYFTRFFKKYTGLSPKDYRSINKNTYL